MKLWEQIFMYKVTVTWQSPTLYSNKEEFLADFYAKLSDDLKQKSSEYRMSLNQWMANLDILSRSSSLDNDQKTYRVVTIWKDKETFESAVNDSNNVMLKDSMTQLGYLYSRDEEQLS